eukprot:12410205-Karenia_brevis.AAC.3
MALPTGLRIDRQAHPRTSTGAIYHLVCVCGAHRALVRCGALEPIIPSRQSATRRWAQGLEKARDNFLANS